MTKIVALDSAPLGLLFHRAGLNPADECRAWTFLQAVPDRFLPITTAAMDLAAELWARARQQGVPTAPAHAIDIDVILAAQLLAHGLAPPDFVVATSNVGHLSRFVPAELWQNT